LRVEWVVNLYRVVGETHNVRMHRLKLRASVAPFQRAPDSLISSAIARKLNDHSCVIRNI
jgi:hypothetical protein